MLNLINSLESKQAAPYIFGSVIVATSIVSIALRCLQSSQQSRPFPHFIERSIPPAPPNSPVIESGHKVIFSDQ